jgi:hypothetical protein
MKHRVESIPHARCESAKLCAVQLPELMSRKALSAIRFKGELTIKGLVIGFVLALVLIGCGFFYAFAKGRHP